MKAISKLIMVVFFIVLLLVGCTVAQTTSTDSNFTATPEVEAETDTENVPEEAEAESEITEAEGAVSVIDKNENDEADKKEVNYQVVKPDESKEIMVIMYHNLSEKNTDYGRTVESFKQDLERLYDMGFRTISMHDYIQNNITVEAGYTPVVLTFDDGHITNFNYIETDGQLTIDPDCVVGILDEFSNTHPGFGRNAIFYLNYGNAFGQSEYLAQKLTYLLENGYEIGNHAFFT